MTGTLEKNPFSVLGASTMDDVHRLARLADEAALFGDADAERAFAEVTHSMRRLDAETRWLPGVEAKAAQEIAAYAAKAEVLPYPELNGFSPLAQLNACRALLSVWKTDDVPSALALCRSLAAAWDGVRAEDVMEQLNEDRHRASLPLIADIGDVYDRLDSLRTEIAAEILERMKVSGVPAGDVLEKAAQDYACTRSRLVETLIHAYALSVRDEALRLEEKLKTMCAETLKSKDICFGLRIKKDIVKTLEAWGRLTSPMRRLDCAKGREDAQVNALYTELYRAASHMYNVLRLHSECAMLLRLYDGVFFDLPSVKEHLHKNLEIAEKGIR